jgi:hypothetical protein
MEIRTEPYDLPINSSIITNCPCCNDILQQKIKNTFYLIDGECGHCRYLDRPFGGCGNTDGGCECEYGNKDYLYIICNKCLSPKCVKCGNNVRCKGDDCNKIICDDCLSPKCVKCGNNVRGDDCNKIICRKCVESEEFNNKWNKSTPQEKLNVYGIKKLKILAKYKKIKGFSKYNKEELIRLLSQCVSKADFPIKSL